MTDAIETPPPRPPAIPILIGVVLLAVATWFIFGARTPQDVRECSALYAAARTAADTTRIDLTVPAGAALHAESRSCGSYRTAGQWQ